MTDLNKDHVATVVRWLGSYREDVDVYLGLLQAPGQSVSERGRETAAGVVGYQLKKFDLAPDWHEAVGYLDDALVLRVGAVVFFANTLTELPEALAAKIGALRDDDAIVQAICGEELYQRFFKRVRALREEQIHGRLPDEVVKDEAKVAELVKATQAYLEGYRVPQVDDGAKLLASVKSYLMHRLPA